jgi:hypothetical protein
MPVFVHFFFGASPIQTDQPFLMVRPLTNGEIVMSMLKAAAISAVYSWLAVLAAFCAMILLGEFRAVVHGAFAQPLSLAAAVIGLLFLTWRMAVVNLCFALPGNRRMASVPVLLILALAACRT